LYVDISTNTASKFNQTIINISGTSTFEFFHFILLGITTVNLNSPITIGGNVYIPDNCIIDDGNLAHNFAGDWTESGNGQLSGNGTINFVAGTPPFIIPVQTITAAATFNNWHVTGLAENVIIQGNVTVTGNFTIANGSNFLCATNVTNSFAGNFSVSDSSAYIQTAGTTIFNGTSAQNVDVDNATFNNLTFNNPTQINCTGNITSNAIVTITTNTTVNSTGTNAFNGGFIQNGICNFTDTLNFGGGVVQSSLAVCSFGTAVISCISGTTTFQQLVGTNLIVFNINNDFTIEPSAHAIFGNCTNNGSVAIIGLSVNSFNLSAYATLTIRGAL